MILRPHLPTCALLGGRRSATRLPMKLATSTVSDCTLTFLGIDGNDVADRPFLDSFAYVHVVDLRLLFLP